MPRKEKKRAATCWQAEDPLGPNKAVPVGAGELHLRAQLSAVARHLQVPILAKIHDFKHRAVPRQSCIELNILHSS
jgi:hypothetical protein